MVTAELHWHLWIHALFGPLKSAWKWLCLKGAVLTRSLHQREHSQTDSFINKHTLSTHSCTPHISTILQRLIIHSRHTHAQLYIDTGQERAGNRRLEKARFCVHSLQFESIPFNYFVLECVVQRQDSQQIKCRWMVQVSLPQTPPNQGSLLMILNNVQVTSWLCNWYQRLHKEHKYLDSQNISFWSCSNEI